MVPSVFDSTDLRRGWSRIDACSAIRSNLKLIFTFNVLVDLGRDAGRERDLAMFAMPAPPPEQLAFIAAGTTFGCFETKEEFPI